MKNDKPQLCFCDHCNSHRKSRLPCYRGETYPMIGKYVCESFRLREAVPLEHASNPNMSFRRFHYNFNDTDHCCYTYSTRRVQADVRDVTTTHTHTTGAIGKPQPGIRSNDTQVKHHCGRIHIHVLLQYTCTHAQRLTTTIQHV